MPSLKSLPIRTQLTAGLAAVIALLSVLGLSALWSLGSVDAGVTTFSDEVVPSLTQVDAVVAGTEAVRQTQYRHLAAATAKCKAKLAAELTGDELAVVRAFARYRSLNGDAAVETQLAPLVDPSETAAAVSAIAERGQDTADPIPEVPVQAPATADLIGESVHTIRHLVEKANLLAMQTGVEADRAGEARPGFAVVADGVRLLADDSQNAASRIASVIQEVQASPSFEGIAGVTETIAGLAEQTRQLGTNAAGEAARAGQAGGRFADIAIEVGQLADEFQAAADRLTALVDEIPSGTDAVQPEAQLIGT